jgi:3D (Asp-Asp-Asp) domain-containing protein
MVMKVSLVVILLWGMLSPCGLAREKPKTVLARVTVYWATGGRGSDRYTRRHKCATGMQLRTGHCAVDPKRIPYGSNIILPDGTSLAAVDTGTAVRNRKAARLSGRTPSERNAVVIDRFFETKGQALEWARTHPRFIAVRVISPSHGGSLRYQAAQPVRRAIAAKSPRKKNHTLNGTPAFAALQLPKIL